MTNKTWRTLEEFAGDPAFEERLHNEFPSAVEEITDPVARRTFLKLMGASIALAGATACTRQPVEKIVPYVRQPEDLIPGRPLFYATAMTVGGVATGLLAESHEGRPTKIEGNPEHPASLGAADVYAQASILGLYDPDRARTITNVGEIRAWPAFLSMMRAALNAQLPLQGAGLRILTESVGSPTLHAQLRALLARYPAARWHQWDPAGRTNTYEGARQAFGEYVETQYRIDKADVIVALDADFLSSAAAHPGNIRYARDFNARRRPDQAARMPRLYAIETMPTSTGSVADHRLPLTPSRIEAFARALASRTAGTPVPAGAAASDPQIQKWVVAIAKDLQAHRGSGLVIVGENQPVAVHVLAHAMNQALGNVGRTLVYTDPVEAAPVDQRQSLRELTGEMNAGKVDLLVILNANPVYSAPAELGFAQALDRVPLRVHLSAVYDETSERCHWHVPEAHFLEAWSDARAYDGTASIVQPLIAPLFAGKSAHEILAAMSDSPQQSGHDIVQGYWKTAAPARTAEWRRWLHDGVIANTAFAPRTVALKTDAVAAATAAAESAGGGSGLEIAFRLDPSLLDGRFANNGWLQELPKPITRLTWDNAVILSPATADRLGVSNHPAMSGGEHGQIIGDVVTLTFRGRTVRGTVFMVPGHAENCAAIHLGFGRERAGQVGTKTGFNAYALRTSDALWSGRDLLIARTGGDASLACTQAHHLMEGRDLVRVATRDEYVRDPKSIHQSEGPVSAASAEGGSGESAGQPKMLTLYPSYEYEGHKWGMAIDINACHGCNACVVACQAENNIPIIGKEEVLRGREMHWLRIDTYYRGERDQPEAFFQPVPCMQCENAPCEGVCPVGATVHSDEGLNDMVYNRCVGTRYCSNNCPYKVRRFNYLLYQDWNTPTLKLGRNPDVTVRSRGVMEKCTYCVQRINEVKIAAEKDNRPVANGEIKTACQQTCPADAIVFGDLNDPNSRVVKLKAEVRNYALLENLNTRPRTTYLGAVRNVNPELGE